MSSSTPSPEPSSTTQAPSTTEAILDAALLVVGERGLKGATTRLIAERAGVNEVTLFRKFGSKSNLILAAIENRFARLRSESVSYSGDVEADLIRLADSYRDMLEHFGPAARVVLAEVPHDPDLARAIHGPRELFAAIAEMLARYQQEGVLRPEPAENLVPAFLGPIIVPHIARFIAEAAGIGSFGFDSRRHVRRFLFGCADLRPASGLTDAGARAVPSRGEEE